MRTPPSTNLSHTALFTGFFQVGILGFGGVLPMARRMMVDQRGWLTQLEFNELFSLCQTLPGANVTNLSAAFGMRHQGVTGAAAALAGLAAAAAGLLLGTAGKIAMPVFKTLRNVAVSVLVLVMALALHVPLLLTMLLALPLSLYLSWRATP